MSGNPERPRFNWDDIRPIADDDPRLKELSRRGVGRLILGAGAAASATAIGVGAAWWSEHRVEAESSSFTLDSRLARDTHAFRSEGRFGEEQSPFGERVRELERRFQAPGNYIYFENEAGERITGAVRVRPIHDENEQVIVPRVQNSSGLLSLEEIRPEWLMQARINIRNQGAVHVTESSPVVVDHHSHMDFVRQFGSGTDRGVLHRVPGQSPITLVRETIQSASPRIGDAALRAELPSLVPALFAYESKFDPNAVSPEPDGALGVAQALPSTWRSLTERLQIENPDHRNLQHMILFAGRHLGDSYRHFMRDEGRAEQGTVGIALNALRPYFRDEAEFRMHFLLPCITNAYNTGDLAMQNVLVWFTTVFMRDHAVFLEGLSGHALFDLMRRAARESYFKGTNRRGVPRETAAERERRLTNFHTDPLDRRLAAVVQFNRLIGSYGPRASEYVPSVYALRQPVEQLS